MRIVLLSVALLFAPAGATAGGVDGGPPDAGRERDGGDAPLAGDATAAVEQAATVGWLGRIGPGPSVAAMALGAAQGALERLELGWLSHDELLERLRRHDRDAGLLAEAGRHLQRGRKLHLGLKLDQARDAYRRALAVLERGFSRFYAPDMLAEPLLQLGVAQHQAGDKAAARKSFMRVASLAPRLELARGYYSPRIRRAFAAARAELEPRRPGVPRPELLARLCAAAGLRALLVATHERLGDRPLVRLSLFDARAAGFVAVETVLIEGESAGRAGADLADRLRPALAALAGLPRPQPDAGAPAVDGGVVESAPGDGRDGGRDAGADAAAAGPPPADAGPLAGFDAGSAPDEPGWAVRHWWIWPVAAAVVAGVAITLPLTVFSEDVVDVRVRY
jgi:hypothetical protein